MHRLIPPALQLKYTALSLPLFPPITRTWQSNTDEMMKQAGDTALFTENKTCGGAAVSQVSLCKRVVFTMVCIFGEDLIGLHTVSLRALIHAGSRLWGMKAKKAKKQKADVLSRSSVTVFTTYLILPLGDFLNGTKPTEHRYLALKMYSQSCVSSVYQGAE